MSWTLCTSGSAIAKAGADANTTITASGSTLAKWSDEAEGSIALMTRREWVVDHSTLGTNVKNALSEIASSMIAKQIITYDMSGYASRFLATTTLNVQDDIIRQNMKALKSFKSNTIKTT